MNYLFPNSVNSQHNRNTGAVKVSRMLGCEEKLHGFKEVKPGVVAKKYQSVCWCPARWRRVVVPTTSAPGRRQHRAEE